MALKTIQEIKSYIKYKIKAEDSTKPLEDLQIARMIAKERGLTGKKWPKDGNHYLRSRVSKCRRDLGILKASERLDPAARKEREEQVRLRGYAAYNAKKPWRSPEQKAYMKKYRKDNHDVIHAQKREWEKDNEEYAEWKKKDGKKRYEENREEISEEGKIKRRERKEAEKEAINKFYRDNSVPEYKFYKGEFALEKDFQKALEWVIVHKLGVDIEHEKYLGDKTGERARSDICIDEFNLIIEVKLEGLDHFPTRSPSRLKEAKAQIKKYKEYGQVVIVSINGKPDNWDSCQWFNPEQLFDLIRELKNAN